LAMRISTVDSVIFWDSISLSVCILFVLLSISFFGFALCDSLDPGIFNGVKPSWVKTTVAPFFSYVYDRVSWMYLKKYGSSISDLNSRSAFINTSFY